MDQHLITEAWAAYDKAARFDEKRSRLVDEGKDALATAAKLAVDKHLDRAVELEAAAFADHAVAA